MARTNPVSTWSTVARYVRLEALAWIAALMYLAAIDPWAGAHLSFCPLHNLGFEFCPGCGLGLSISYLLHGDILASWYAHPLGIPAAVLLVSRIVVIMYRTRTTSNILAYGGRDG